MIGATHVISHVNPSGERSSTSSAYLPTPVLDRPNLKVLIDSRITRVLFDDALGSEPRVVGVEIAQSANGPRFRVGAAKEVILSAGAIGTPQILMASGVGPRGELEGASVRVVKELPHVGKNLYDVRFVSFRHLSKWLLISFGSFHSIYWDVSCFARRNRWTT